jgi:hypothetical protein
VLLLLRGAHGPVGVSKSPPFSTAMNSCILIYWFFIAD